MKIYDQFKYKGASVKIQESAIARGYQFKCLVNKMSLGCFETEIKAKMDAIQFIDRAEQAKLSNQ